MTGDESEQSNDHSKGAWFGKTSWTVIATAQQPDSPEAREALEKLCRTYWYPLYAYIRRLGCRSEDAEDLTQAFFYQLLRRNFLGAVDRKKGKFRSFLLVALRHFRENERDYANAAKRGGGQKVLSLDETLAEARYLKDPTSDSSPETSFERDWATTVSDRVQSQIEEEHQRAGKMLQFETLRCFLSSATDPGDYNRVAEVLGMTPNAVAITVYRLRHRFGELLREELAQTVASPEDLEDEIRHFFAVQARSSES